MDYQEAIERLERGYLVDSNGDTTQKDFEALKIAIFAMNELQQYKQIGTLEEVRDAVEKQKAKKPNNVGTEGYRYTDTYRCPACGGNFSGTGIADYCYHCGQAIDWSEDE